MTRAPTHKFHVTPKDSILCDYVLLLNIHLYMCILYGVLLHNNLIGCNCCDTSSPHNAMHSSSTYTYGGECPTDHSHFRAVKLNTPGMEEFPLKAHFLKLCYTKTMHNLKGSQIFEKMLKMSCIARMNVVDRYIDSTSKVNEAAVLCQTKYTTYTVLPRLNTLTLSLRYTCVG